MFTRIRHWMKLLYGKKVTKLSHCIIGKEDLWFLYYSDESFLVLGRYMPKWAVANFGQKPKYFKSEDCTKLPFMDNE